MFEEEKKVEIENEIIKTNRSKIGFGVMMASIVRKVRGEHWRESNIDGLEEDDDFSNASEDNVMGSDVNNENYMKGNNANNGAQNSHVNAIERRRRTLA